jgi:hypothetical protein
LRNKKEYEDIYIPFIIKELIIVFIIVTFHWVFISFSSPSIDDELVVVAPASSRSRLQLESSSPPGVSLMGSASQSTSSRKRIEGSVTTSRSRKLPTPSASRISSPLTSSPHLEEGSLESSVKTGSPRREGPSASGSPPGSHEKRRPSRPSEKGSLSPRGLQYNEQFDHPSSSSTATFSSGFSGSHYGSEGSRPSLVANSGSRASASWGLESAYEDTSARELRTPAETDFGLSLYGGGVRALIQAQIVREFERRHGINLVRRARIIAAASGGAITAFSHLVQKPYGSEYKFTPDEIIDAYAADARRIFRKSWNPFKGFSGPLYRQRNLQEVLREKFGDVQLSQIGNPSQEITVPVARRDDMREIYHFRKSLAEKDRAHDYLVWQLLAGAGSPPVLFPPANVTSLSGESVLMFDGGTFENNPELEMFNVVDQWAFEKRINMKNLIVLSIGTGVESSFRGSRGAQQEGLSQIGFRPLLGSLVHLRDKVNHYLAQDIFERRGVRYQHFQPTLERGKAKLDLHTNAQIEYLRHTAMGYFSSNEARQLAEWLKFSDREKKGVIDLSDAAGVSLLDYEEEEVSV